MEYTTLNNGVKMPMLGFGVWQLAEGIECEQAVEAALQTGYRHIDTAAAYLNERSVGRAIKASGIPREELFITSKVWLQDAGYEQTHKAFLLALDRLGLEYLDLYLIHQPFGDYYGSWRAMENLYREGKIRAIGVANFYPDRLVDLIMHNDIRPAVNQIETHPFFQRQEDQRVLQEYGIQHESWAPFAEGRHDLFNNEVLQAIGAAYHKSIAQIVVRWLLQRGIVCIPKSASRDHIVENFNVFDFSLSAFDMQAIVAMDLQESCFFSHFNPKTVRNLSKIRYDF